jgi:hypothetical protein
MGECFGKKIYEKGTSKYCAKLERIKSLPAFGFGKKRMFKKKEIKCKKTYVLRNCKELHNLG